MKNVVFLTTDVHATLIDDARFKRSSPAARATAASWTWMQCSILDKFSYGQVRVTANRLTITPKGIDGQSQRDGAQPCGPVVLTYQR